jgi:outer membrane protein assembly factor BamB
VTRKVDRMGGDWPVFGANNAHTGGYAATLGRHRFVPAWSATNATTNPVITGDGRVYASFGTYQGTDSSVSSYDLQTGQKLWSMPLPAASSISPPTFHRGLVYLQRGRSLTPADLRCFDASTGALRWAAPFASQGFFYYAPTVDDRGIFMNGGEHGGLYRFGLDGTPAFHYYPMQ